MHMINFQAAVLWKEAGTRVLQAVDWRLWQVVDSAFPAGGFAHSGGLEAAWQSGWVRGAADLRLFVEESVGQAARGSVPFARAAFLGDDWRVLDEMLDSMLPNHVARRASRAQGIAFLATATDVFCVPGLLAMRAELMRRGGGHWAVIFGAVLREVLVEGDVAWVSRMHLFMTMRGIFSAAVRLGIVGPLEAQRIQVGMDEHLDAAVESAAGVTIADVCQTAPLLELWQMGQDRLYSRLFQS